MDTATLLPRIIAGDSRAYAEVVRTYQHMVYTVCHRVLRNSQDAEEATQDSFIKAYQNIRSYSGSAKFSTWLYSIAYRTAISHGRKRSTDGHSVDEMAQHPAAQRDAGLEQTDIKLQLEKALATLDAEDASIISFYYLEELSVEEIVTVTGLSASNVKVKLFRSRKKLSDALQNALGPEAASLLLDHA
ncbi:MAG: sigma-70 family RNA polymerase sigma factor [Bacteroidota bacterium]|nr:sigma-70 family RNA polymerase sigma factor [Bacteroidota bacterium]